LQISGDIEIGAIALCSRPIRSAFSKMLSIPASALEILAAAKNAGVMPYSKIINDRGSPDKERV
jgi:hypothetical protein